MKTTPETLQKQWNTIECKDGGFLQIDIRHPLEWHIGYQSISQKTLLLVSNMEIGAFESSKSMRVSRRRREDNRWTLTFELLRNEQQDVFAILCWDMIEYSLSAADEKEALTLVVRRYKQWSKLLESQPSGLLDEYRRKGLLGELLFLERRLELTNSALATVQGWVGPDGADQDFMYADGWFEIKSIVASATSVTISSLEQLGCADEGELVIQRIDKVAPERSGAISLNDAVRHIDVKLADNPDALELFHSKLGAYGYIDLQEYSEQKYLRSATERYRVDDSFPRMTAKSVPTQIVSLHYELNLPSLIDWQKK